MLPMIYMSLVDDEDVPAFEELYNTYNARVFAIALDILNNNELAEEAANDVFLAIAKCFKFVNNLEYHKRDYYIVIISRNQAIDKLRKEKATLDNIKYDDDVFLSNSFMADYDEAFLRDQIKALRKTDKEILYLRYSLGMGYKDIAQSLGIKQNTARKRVQYARDNLKRLLIMEDE